MRKIDWSTVLLVVLVIGFLIIWLWAIIVGPLKACYNGDPISETPNYCMGRK